MLLVIFKSFVYNSITNRNYIDAEMFELGSLLKISQKFLPIWFYCVLVSINLTLP